MVNEAQDRKRFQPGSATTQPVLRRDANGRLKLSFVCLRSLEKRQYALSAACFIHFILTSAVGRKQYIPVRCSNLHLGEYVASKIYHV